VTRAECATALFELVRRGKVDQVVAAVQGLDAPARKQIGAELTAWVKQRRDNWWFRGEATGLAVVAVATLPSAAAAASMLGRRSVSLSPDAAPPVLTVARDRGVTWPADLAHRLAAKMRSEDDGGMQFVAEILLAEGAAPPAVDGFVEAWLMRLNWSEEARQGVPLADRLRVDPFLDPLLPRLFEIDGIGGLMGFSAYLSDEKDLLPKALAALASERRLDRQALLDGCLGRLLRGERPAASRPFIALHDLLAPTGTEIADRAAGYLRLLADAPTAAATMAQRSLRTVDGLDLDSLLDASRAVLTRPDKALVRAQLAWLDKLARAGDRRSEIAAAIASAAGSPAVDIRDRAAALAVKHGHTPAVVSVVVGGDDLPPPPVPALASPPIVDPDELAEEVGVLLDGRFGAPMLDRVLDGLVRLAAADQPRLAKALVPVIDRHRPTRVDTSSLWGSLIGVLDAGTDLRAAAGRRGLWAGMLASARRLLSPERPDLDPGLPPVHRLLRARLAEIGSMVGPGHRPVGLVAAPTHANGALDPGVLLDRLAALGDDREPWPWDLAQALLRLPARVDEGLAARAAALGTQAGDRVAGWLRAGGLPEPSCQVVTVAREGRDAWLPERRMLVALRSTAPDLDPLGLSTVRATTLGAWHSDWSAVWPAALPGYRGLVAAYALPEVASAADMDRRGGAAALPLIADGTGDGGPALALALAYGLGARHEQDRVATVDAMVTLAAAGDLDAAAVGGFVGELGAGGMLTLPRVVQPLRDLADAGARLSVWRLLAAALPGLLDAGRGVPDLLTLAAETATATGVRLDVPGVAEVAARGGSARVVVEARRLTRALRAGGPG